MLCFITVAYSADAFAGFTGCIRQGHRPVMNSVLLSVSLGTEICSSCTHLYFGYAVTKCEIFHCQNLKSIFSTVTYLQSTQLLIAKRGNASSAAV